ncbi:uncharacterized protein LOC110694842 [Chenopodium quinoa]|uniref:uncharacterized protein LOC110694842 n=1 Tax=Chenopodium quinoa TaxID=63459 RepID=UPI000B787F58|nr:uncharacterized protein LOC110694842 [Chenopodium quinoa]
MALERSPPRAPSTPSDSFLEECDQGGNEAVSVPLTQNEEETESDSSASTSESSDDLPPLQDKEALNMLTTEKTPQRSSALIRKQLAKKAAAEVKAKGGEVGKAFKKQLKRAREETPSILHKSKKSTSASTPGASAGKQQLRIAGRIERASRIQQLEADLETAKQRESDAETAQKKAEEAREKADEGAKKADEALKKAQADLGTLQGVSEANTKLKAKVEKLEKEAAQAQKNFAVTLEAEQNRLVAESDADNDARMKIAWAAFYPNADYNVWALAHSYAEYVVYLRDRGEPEPDSFEA